MSCSVRKQLEVAGILKPLPIDVAAVLRKLSVRNTKAPPTWYFSDDAAQALSHFSPIENLKLKWAEYKPNTEMRLNFGQLPVAYTLIPERLILEVRQSESGHYNAKHRISLHTYTHFENKVIVTPEPLVMMWFKCHYDYDREKIVNFTNTTMRQYIQAHLKTK